MYYQIFLGRVALLEVTNEAVLHFVYWNNQKSGINERHYSILHTKESEEY
jgi:hypothetical protein